jgi:hypothetical protein
MIHPARVSLPYIKITALLAIGVAATLACAGEHPRLLVSAADVPRLRHACGSATAAATLPEWGRSGAHSADFQAVRAAFVHPHEGELLPGELAAAAFLHLMDPLDAGDALRLRAVNATLQQATPAMTDFLEVVLALDWCWADLEPAARREVLLSVHNRAEPFTPADSPLEPRRFQEKLALLALALTVDETDEPSPSWLALRERLLAAATTYFTTTFPTFVAWRGLSPTSPASAPGEERNTALAIELAGQLLQRDLWPEYRPTVGRWLEHYLCATIDHPALQHNFIRDDGSSAPLTPAPAWRDLLPVTAHLIAVRTQDPAAVAIAERVETALREPGAGDLRALWRWVPIVLDIAGLPRCDLRGLPTARNLGGAVILRGGSGPDTTAVWIDAAPPFLRRREHFDAGHFLIYRGGQLAVDGGDDVTFEAIASKGGAQHLGHEREPFDFEQYFTATIAHNCLVLWDPARITHWYNEPYLPIGGQRCLEGTCTDFVRPLDAQGRQTGRQLAYGQNAGAAYLALDLTPAYESRLFTTYTREFVFLCDRVLIVVDRVALPKGRPVPTWVLNLPARPQADGADLNEKARVAGTANDAGVWRYDDATWLRWTDRDGALWLHAPLPADKCLRVVGGPARLQSISDGRGGVRSYVGGTPDGFERLIIPAERRGARNAWYELGQATPLTPDSASTPHWGRIEIEPTARASATTFLTVLVTDRADSRDTPTATLASGDDDFTLDLRVGEAAASVRFSQNAVGGTVTVRGPSPLTWTLPTEIEADPPLAVLPPISPPTSAPQTP